MTVLILKLVQEKKTHTTTMLRLIYKDKTAPSTIEHEISNSNRLFNVNLYRLITVLRALCISSLEYYG